MEPNKMDTNGGLQKEFSFSIGWFLDFLASVFIFGGVLRNLTRPKDCNLYCIAPQQEWKLW